MKLPALEALEQAADLVHEVMAPTPQISWPLLGRRVGAEVWVKHENHTPLGAFKIRGGVVCFAELKRDRPDARGVQTGGNVDQPVFARVLTGGGQASDGP